MAAATTRKPKAAARKATKGAAKKRAAPKKKKAHGGFAAAAPAALQAVQLALPAMALAATALAVPEASRQSKLLGAKVKKVTTDAVNRIKRMMPKSAKGTSSGTKKKSRKTTKRK